MGPAEALRTYGGGVVADALRDLGYSERRPRPGSDRSIASTSPWGRLHGALRAVGRDDDRGFLPLAAFIDSGEPGEVLVLGAAEGAICRLGLGRDLLGEQLQPVAECAGVVVDGFMRDDSPSNAWSCRSSHVVLLPRTASAGAWRRRREPKPSAGASWLPRATGSWRTWTASCSYPARRSKRRYSRPQRRNGDAGAGIARGDNSRPVAEGGSREEVIGTL